MMPPTVAAQTFDLLGTTYRLEPLSFQQAKWMAEHVLFDAELGLIDGDALHDLLRERGHLLAAIALVPDGQTRAAHASQPWPTLAERAQAFSADVDFDTLLEVGAAFFTIHPPQQVVKWLAGTQRRRVLAQALALATEATESGSRTASSSSATATLPSSDPSSWSGGLTSASGRSDDGPNIEKPSAPFLASAASSCPG